MAVCFRTMMFVLMLILKSKILLFSTNSSVPHNSIRTKVYGIEPESEKLFGNIDTLSIPLKRAGNLLLVETEIDGVRGNLIFDSGSTAELVLNTTYFREKRVKNRRETVGITGNSEHVDVVLADSVTVARHVYHRIYADLKDLSHIENRKNTKILGFFGLKLIKEFEIILDVHTDALILNRIKNLKKEKKLKIRSDYDYVGKVEIIENVVFVQAQIDKKDYRFCFDTGAERNVLSVSLPQKTMECFKIVGRAGLSGASSKKKDVLFGITEDFSFGEKKIKQFSAVFTDLGNLSEMYGVEIAGILGYEFLTIGKISLNCETRTLSIKYSD